MDGPQFDHLTKRLAAPHSRRATLKGLGKTMLLGLGIGGPIAVIARSTAVRRAPAASVVRSVGKMQTAAPTTVSIRIGFAAAVCLREHPDDLRDSVLHVARGLPQ